jgi:predicted ATPase with chaperone activity
MRDSIASVRVETAVRQCGFPMPLKHFVVNLAPADIRKEGTAFDLPMAVGRQPIPRRFFTKCCWAR